MFSVPAWDADGLPSAVIKAEQRKATGKIKNKENKKKVKKNEKLKCDDSLVTPSHVTMAMPSMFGDSDDDDESRRLSRKAKKRLREKRRKQKSKFLSDEDLSLPAETAAGVSYLDQEGSEDDAGGQKKTKKRKLLEEPVDYLNTDLMKVFQEAGLLSNTAGSQKDKGNAKKSKKRKLAAPSPSMGGDGKGIDPPSDSTKKKKKRKKKKKPAASSSNMDGDEKSFDSSSDLKKKKKRKRAVNDDALSGSSPKKTKVNPAKNSSVRGGDKPAPDLANGSSEGVHSEKKKKRKRNKKKKASVDVDSHDTSIDKTNASQTVKSKETLSHRDQNGLKSHSTESGKVTNTEMTEGKEGKKRKKKKNSKKNKYKHLVKDSNGKDVSQSEHDVEDLNSQRKQNIPKPIHSAQDEQEKTSLQKKKEKKQKKAKTKPGAQEESPQNMEKTPGMGKKPKKTPAAGKHTEGNHTSDRKTPVSANGQMPFDRQKLAAMLKSSPARAAPEAGEEARPAGLKERLEAELSAAHFRYLNEKLYTCSGREAQTLFKKDQEAFQVYHQGFQNQVARWPVNPVDVIIKEIKSRPASLRVADFGCGDAKLARSLPNQVHSFDLVALNEHITVCDIAKVPLPDEAVHIAVFCLSLMGTNLVDYLLEANRVLKQGGMLKIAEVASRLTRLNNFILDVEKLGFKFENKDDSNKMFILLNFKKKKPVTKAKGLPEITLPPCLYKKR